MMNIRMPGRFISISIILILTYFSPCISKSAEKEIAANIRDNYETVLYTFKPEIQKHFAVRMYRIYGDEKYIFPIIFDLNTSLGRIMRDVKFYNDSAYLESRLRQLLDDFNVRTKKGRIRKNMFEDHGPMLLYLDMLYNTNKIYEYKLHKSAYYDLFERSISLLRQIDFKSFLLDTSVIRIYAPQAVNDVYYLFDLGLDDIRDEYKSAFINIFPDEQDNEFTPREYMDKIYGLTHIILAASRYYQNKVDSAEFAWILDYFKDNIDRILRETKEDVIAEVGICFLLAGREKSPALEGCRKAIVEAYDEKARMIPSTRRNKNMEIGEHRNCLAIMLLGWPDKLHPGPYLNELEQIAPYLLNCDIAN